MYRFVLLVYGIRVSFSLVDNRSHATLLYLWFLNRSKAPKGSGDYSRVTLGNIDGKKSSLKQWTTWIEIKRPPMPSNVSVILSRTITMKMKNQYNAFNYFTPQLSISENVQVFWAWSAWGAMRFSPLYVFKRSSLRGCHIQNTLIFLKPLVFWHDFSTRTKIRYQIFHTKYLVKLTNSVQPALLNSCWTFRQDSISVFTSAKRALALACYLFF